MSIIHLTVDEQLIKYKLAINDYRGDTVQLYDGNYIDELSQLFYNCRLLYWIWWWSQVTCPIIRELYTDKLGAMGLKKKEKHLIKQLHYSGKYGLTGQNTKYGSVAINGKMLNLGLLKISLEDFLVY